MNELNQPNHNQNNSSEIFPPKLSFEVVKASQLFANTLLSHSKDSSSWQVRVPDDYQPGEIDSGGRTGKLIEYLEMQYGFYGSKSENNDDFLGDIRDWDSKLFSFKQSNLGDEDMAQFKLFFPLEAVLHPAVEISYWVSHRDSHTKDGIDVVLPFEGPPKIKSKNQDRDWRLMTKTEGESLLVDLGDALDKLQQHISEN